MTTTVSDWIVDKSNAVGSTWPENVRRFNTCQILSTRVGEAHAFVILDGSNLVPSNYRLQAAAEIAGHVPVSLDALRWRVLNLVRKHPGIRAEQIADELDMSFTRAFELADELTDLELIGPA